MRAVSRLSPSITRKFKAASKNVIPAKAGIQKLLISPDSLLRGGDKWIIIRGSLKEKMKRGRINN
jgi:hypothetical protein